jgi:CMP-N-acetylneuraminic acid synthetase
MFMVKNMFTAIVPVRAGSRRVKDKNIRAFGESNLLVHKIRQLKEVVEIGKIVVSSDSEKMLSMAEQEGVGVHKRSWEYCDEKTAPFGDVVKNVCQNVEGQHIIWALCTAPLIMPVHYREAIAVYKEKLSNGEHDSLIAVQEFKKYVWDDDGPVNFSPGRGHVPSQNLPQWYLTTGLRIAPREKMIEWAYFTGVKPHKYVIPSIHCVDIDEEVDFFVAESLYKKIVSR